MSNGWDEMRKAKEESYFDKKNREALERLAKKKEDQPRISPVSGQPMEQIVLHGVVIDRCPVSGGIWLDAGELEQLLATATSGEAASGAPAENLLTQLLRSLTGK